MSRSEVNIKDIAEWLGLDLENTRDVLEAHDAWCVTLGARFDSFHAFIAGWEAAKKRGSP